MRSRTNEPPISPTPMRAIWFKMGICVNGFRKVPSW
ncbi:hypothetical protein N875_08915 [Neisseria meningitidis LNP21362]|nr:hypothetical protein N875_08915 [Neisseria meningitidis LNP21362]